MHPHTHTHTHTHTQKKKQNIKLTHSWSLHQTTGIKGGHALLATTILLMALIIQNKLIAVCLHTRGEVSFSCKSDHVHASSDIKSPLGRERKKLFYDSLRHHKCDFMTKSVTLCVISLSLKKKQNKKITCLRGTADLLGWDHPERVVCTRRDRNDAQL